MNELKGRVALVTGASRGLGKSIALELAKAGAILALIGRDEEKLKTTAAEAKQCDDEAHVFVADVAQETQVRKLKQTIQEQFGRLDILVNNAGIMLRRPLEDCTLDEWRSVIETNLTSVFLICNAFVPLMRERTYGRIINITSTLSHV